MSMLEVKNLVVSYGAIKALKGISFNVEQGEVITLIGSNGAGKTTTLHSISNLIKKESGSILLRMVASVPSGFFFPSSSTRVMINLDSKPESVFILE